MVHYHGWRGTELHAIGDQPGMQTGFPVALAEAALILEEHGPGVGDIGAAQIVRFAILPGREISVVLAKVNHPIAQPFVGIIHNWAADDAILAAGMGLHGAAQPVRRGKAVLFDDRDNRAMRLLDAAAPQLRHRLALRTVDDPHPGKLAREPFRIGRVPARHYDDLGGAVLDLPLDGFQAFIDERGAHNGRDYY